MRKTIQTLNGAVFVAGKGKECANAECEYFGQHYLAYGVLKYSLPQSTYGLDVLAFIGWQHEHEHQQLVEIQHSLNQRGVNTARLRENRWWNKEYFVRVIHDL